MPVMDGVVVEAMMEEASTRLLLDKRLQHAATGLLMSWDSIVNVCIRPTLFPVDSAGKVDQLDQG